MFEMPSEIKPTSLFGGEAKVGETGSLFGAKKEGVSSLFGGDAAKKEEPKEVKVD